MRTFVPSASFALALALGGCASWFEVDENVETWGADEAEGEVGKVIEIAFLPGRQQFRAESDAGGFFVEVDKVRNDYAQFFVETEVRVMNRFEERLVLDLDRVRLHYGGQDYPARGGAIQSGGIARVRGKNWLKQTWRFDIGTVVEAGVFDVVIDRPQLEVAGQRRTVELELRLPLRVPGEKLAADDFREG